MFISYLWTDTNYWEPIQIFSFSLAQLLSMTLLEKNMFAEQKIFILGFIHAFTYISLLKKKSSLILYFLKFCFYSF